MDLYSRETGLLSLLIAALIQSSSGRDPSWEVASHSFGEWADGSGTSEEAFIAIISIALVLLLWAQIFVGKVLLGLASKYEKLNREQIQTNDKTQPAQSSLSSKEESAPGLSSADYESGNVIDDSTNSGDDRGGDVLAEEEIPHDMGTIRVI